MNRIIKFAAIVAVGSASFGVSAQSDTNAPAPVSYGQFRPLEGEQAVAAEQPAPVQAPAAAAPPVQPTSPPEQPAAAAAPAMPSQAPHPMVGAPYGAAPGGHFGPGYGYPHGGDPSWTQYQARKRMMQDANQYRRYARPRYRHGPYRGFGGPYGGMPAPYPGAQAGPWTAAPAEGEAPEAPAGQSGY